ncbi:MAG: O-antigen ligase family protein [Rhodospirillales bacterium]|nr:O-antigen ligase family protein [Rhodospirillales bacterium]
MTAIFCGFAALLPIVCVVAPKGTVVLLLLAALLAIPTYWWVNRRMPVPDLRIAIALTLFVLWCAIASAWSADATRSIVLVLRIGVIFAAGMALFPIAAALDDAARARVGRWLIGGFVLALVLVSAEIALGYPLLRLFEAAEAGKKLVWFNRSAVALALIVWPVTGLLWARGLGWKVLAIPGLLGIASVFLESAAATHGLVVGLAAALLVLCHRKAGFLVTTAAGAMAFVGMPFAALEMHNQGWHGADWLPASAQHRVEIWNFSVHRIAEKSLLGWGFDGSRHMGMLYPDPSDTGRTVAALHPHSVPLQVMLELGTVGAVMALALLWLIARRLDGVSGRTRVFGQALFVAALAIGSVAHGAWQNWWLALVISVALLVPLTAAPASTGNDPLNGLPP